MRQPNVLLIILDTLRRDRLSAYGHRRETSPAFDDFASRASLFTRAVAPSHWTIPAHASLFTGVYPSTHQVTQADSQLSGSYPTLAEILQGGGYHTAAFCNNPLVGVLLNGLGRGFADFYNYAGAVPNRPRDDGANDVQARFLRWFRPHARRITSFFSQHDAVFRASLHPLLTPIWTKYVNFKGDTAASIGDAIDYWDAYHAGGADQPLFMFVNLMGAHLPYRPPLDALERVAPDVRGDQHAFRFINRLNRSSADWASPREQPLADWEDHALKAFYDAEIAAQDAQLGRLLDHLARTGALRDTLVVIAADHGECHGEHDLFGHTFDVHQELVHVPLVIHHPDYSGASSVETNVSTRRLFHTILDAAGVEPPLDRADPNADVARLSLLPLLDGAADGEGGIAFSEAFAPLTYVHLLERRSPALLERLGLRETRRAVYQGDYKLVLRGDQVAACYDVAADPDELHDIRAAESERIADMRARVEAFVRVAELSRADSPRTVPVSAEVVEHLRALGYIE